MAEEYKSPIEQIAETMNRRGHATTFARDNKLITKERIEFSVATEWANSMRETFDVDISDVQHAHAAHPDCFAYYKGERLNLELTELVRQNILATLAKKNKGAVTEFQYSSFEEGRWLAEEFLNEIGRILDSKSQKYLVAGMNVDALIIYTDENWLHPQSVRGWLDKATIGPRANIRNAYLLTTYVPGYADGWPIFRIYGSL